MARLIDREKWRLWAERQPSVRGGDPGLWCATATPLGGGRACGRVRTCNGTSAPGVPACRAAFRARDYTAGPVAAAGVAAVPGRKGSLDAMSPRDACATPVPKVACYEDKSPDARRIQEPQDAKTPSRKVEEHALLASLRPGDLAFAKFALEQANHCGGTPTQNAGKQPGQLRRTQPHVRGSLGHALADGGPRSVVAMIVV